MVSIKMFGVRDEERPMAENWAKEHNVKIDMTSDILTSDTIDEVKGFDGLTLMQVAEVTDDLYLVSNKSHNVVLVMICTI